MWWNTLPSVSYYILNKCVFYENIEKKVGLKSSSSHIQTPSWCWFPLFLSYELLMSFRCEDKLRMDFSFVLVIMQMHFAYKIDWLTLPIRLVIAKFYFSSNTSSWHNTGVLLHSWKERHKQLAKQQSKQFCILISNKFRQLWPYTCSALFRW